LLRHYCGIIAV